MPSLPTKGEELVRKLSVDEIELRNIQLNTNTAYKDLLPKNVSTQVFKVLLESNAGEQGARMAAMDNATRNAGEMIDDLSLIYNRSRQAKITSELIEIISGAEAL